LRLDSKTFRQRLRIEERRKTSKALGNFQKNSADPEQPQAPSSHKRKKYQRIPNQVRALVAKNVFYEGSMTSVWRIINAEKKRAIEGEPTPRPQKRGRKSPLVNPEILIFDDITTSVIEKFHIETSPAAVKAAIPEDWNKDTVLQARIVYVRDLGQAFFRNIVYVDEKPWNMHKKKTKGHALRGEPAKLTLVPKGKNLTMIAALSRTIRKRAPLQRTFETSSSISCQKFHEAPPYSPFLNPIEYAFSTIQSVVQAEQWYTRGDLQRVVEDKVQTAITAEKAEGFFRHSFTGKPLNPDILEERAAPTPNQRLQITELRFPYTLYN
jgi:hypothetical protein